MQNQNHDTKTVIRQYCRENSIPKPPVWVSSCSTSVISAASTKYLWAMAWASSKRRSVHNQRGDSGRPIRAINKTTAMIVLDPRTIRHGTPCWARK